jgi:hypothetical protein
MHCSSEINRGFIMPGFTDAAKKAKKGQSCTEGLLYFLATSMMISALILLFDFFIPGTEFVLPGGGTWYISHEFYRANVFTFNTIAIMLGLLISSAVIWFHKRSVQNRILKYSKGMD